MPFLAQTTSLTRYRLTDHPARQPVGRGAGPAEEEFLPRHRRHGRRALLRLGQLRRLARPDVRRRPAGEGGLPGLQPAPGHPARAAGGLQKHYQIALKQSLGGHRRPGEALLSKERKRELREQVALRLRARALPVPAVFEVVWNTQTDSVWLATTNAKVRDLFEDVFSATFEAGPGAPGALLPGRPHARPGGHVAKLEALEPSDFAG